MGGQRHPPERSKSEEVSAPALRRYYEGLIPLKQLFTPVGTVPTDVRNVNQWPALLTDLGDLDPEFRKTVRLATGRPCLTQWLRAWCQAVIEQEMGRGLDPEEASTSFGLRRLFTRSAQGLSDRKAAIRRREFNFLRLTLVWIHSGRQLDPIALSEEVGRLIVPNSKRSLKDHDLEREAVFPLLNATSLDALRKAFLSLRFWIECARKVRAEAFEATENVRALTGKISALQRDMAVARDKVQDLENRLEESVKQAASLSRALDSERNMRINALRAAKGRFQRFLEETVALRLRGARDALDGDPVAVDVALERIEAIMERLEEEREWLSSD